MMETGDRPLFPLRKSDPTATGTGACSRARAWSLNAGVPTCTARGGTKGERKGTPRLQACITPGSEAQTTDLTRTSRELAGSPAHGRSGAPLGARRRAAARSGAAASDSTAACVTAARRSRTRATGRSCFATRSIQRAQASSLLKAARLAAWSSSGGTKCIPCSTPLKDLQVGHGRQGVQVALA